MNDPLPEDADKRLEMLFRPAAAPIDDAGFTDQVMARIARRAWRRRLVLGLAGLAGGAMAAQPLWYLAGTLSQQLTVLGGRWAEFAWILQSPLALAAGLLIVVGPGLMQWLEE